jgi:UDP-2,4-diacetamido-2,4,6-trideoxy-beta-L-altropyranose hydrolase
MNSPLLIRADASPRMGTGHVMRSLALAQAWQEENRDVVFAMAEHFDKIDSRLASEGMQITHLPVEPGSEGDMRATIGAAEDCGARWVVLDGYQFRGKFQRALREAGLQVLALDDYGHCEHYWADLILNQDVNAEPELYASREPSTRMLLGTRYILLRREFSALPRPPAKTRSAARSVLLTLGGADPWNFTARILNGLAQIRSGDVEVTAVVGPGNPHGREVEAAAQKFGARARVLVAPPDMPSLMQKCDLAISAGGSTMWELAYFRVPTMVLVLAENQLSTALVLKRIDACRVLENARELEAVVLADEILRLANDTSAQESYAEVFGNLVDGRGARRVCQELSLTKESAAVVRG